MEDLLNDINSTLELVKKEEKFAELFLPAEKIFKNGFVQTLSQGRDFFEFLVEEDSQEYKVSFDFSEKIAGSCSCKTFGWCKHRLAAILEAKDILASRSDEIGVRGRQYTRQGMINRVLEERKWKAKNAKYRMVFSQNPYGEHTLINEKGVKYKILFRDFKSQTGYCSCSDYAHNHLGTCKHLIFAFGLLKTSRKKIKSPFPFVEIYLNPLNNYQISYFYPGELPPEAGELIKKYFGNKKHIGEEDLINFLPFIREAQDNPQILIRPEVLDEIGNAFDRNILHQKSQNIKPDYSDIKADLYPYQKEGIEFALFKKGVIIADEMGLGKTIQAMSAAILKKKYLGFERTLIICPASLKSQWQSEIEKFSNEKAVVVEGKPEEREEIYKNSDAYFFIINYETVLRDKDEINKSGFDLVILDEAQRIKNFETMTANAVKSLKRNHSLVITGTPIENQLADIYSIVGFASPGFLGPLWEFSYQHCYFDQSNENRITGYYNLQNLKERLKPILIRREKRDVIKQLNNLTFRDVFVELHPKQRELHASFASAIASILAKKFKTPYDMQMLTMNLQSMRMVCDSTFLIDKTNHISPKLIELEEILVEKLDLLNNDRKIIIFSEWTTMNTIIAKMLAEKGIGFTEFNGKVPVAKRKALIKEFETNPKCQVFISTEAGGSGLNLQVADTVINFELPWNPAKKNQRIGRIDRLGQKHENLTVINLITKNSIEIKIATGLMVKQRLFDGVLNDDNLQDVVDFSEKGRAQFLQELELAMGEFTAEPGDEEIMEIISDPQQINLFAEEEEEENREKEAKMQEKLKKLEEMELVMNKGMDFLAGLFKMSTGKDLKTGENKIEIDRETGEVIMRFKVDF